MNAASHRPIPGAERRAYYARLYRKFVLVTLVFSLVPLLLVGWGINVYYAGFSRSRTMDTFRTVVENHRHIIELFLKERILNIRLIAQTHSVEYLRSEPNLKAIFDVINLGSDSFKDLGVIDERGRHLAYVGPYQLMDKDYSQAFWFREVMEKGVYVSDMFMGYRAVPHFIVAVRRSQGQIKWILRATIDTEVFRSLVEQVKIGKTGEAFLLSQEGIFQTSPRFSGRIMARASFPLEPFHQEIRVKVLEAGEDGQGESVPRQLAAHVWLQEPRWMLVVKQNHDEAFGDIHHANTLTLVFLHLSALTILIVSLVITRRMIKVLKRQDEAADDLNRQLMQASKMASIGEMAAGVAHEINNPLAIILTERQILLDEADDVPDLPTAFRDQLSQSLSQVDSQVQRCKRITQNLLRFSRRTKSLVDKVDLNAFLGEVVELMEREARASGVRFETDFQEGLPPILSDPSQLQQVFLNLMTNAIDAHEGTGGGSIRLVTRSIPEKRGVAIEVADSGCGIPPEALEKIFDPFFTTKPVGKGTGLGLSICYGSMNRLGGEINVESELGRGTRFLLFLPLTAPEELRESLGEPGRGG